MLFALPGSLARLPFPRRLKLFALQRRTMGFFTKVAIVLLVENITTAHITIGPPFFTSRPEFLECQSIDFLPPGHDAPSISRTAKNVNSDWAGAITHTGPITYIGSFWSILWDCFEHFCFGALPGPVPDLLLDSGFQHLNTLFVPVK